MATHVAQPRAELVGVFGVGRFVIARPRKISVQGVRAERAGTDHSRVTDLMTRAGIARRPHPPH